MDACHWQYLADSWIIRTVRCSIPGGSTDLSKSPDRLWGLPSLLFSGYRGSYLGQQQPGREADLLPRLRTSGAVSFHGLVRNNLALHIPLYDGGGVSKPSPRPPPTILSEVAPKFYNRYPEYCLLTEERNTVREPTLYVWGALTPGVCGTVSESPSAGVLARRRYVSGRSCDRPSRHRLSWFSSVLKQLLKWFPVPKLQLRAFDEPSQFKFLTI